VGVNAPDLLRVVSVSGGKDSTATLLLALETNWLDDVRAVFADTGNEHEITLEYVKRLSDYLERETGRRIETVRADFTRQIAAKRKRLERIANGEPESAVYGARRFARRWDPRLAGQAAALLEPTGNVFLDLCLLKGGFPSRKHQWCTENLKSEPIERWQAALLDAYRAEQWHGVRGDESPRRAVLPDYEWGARLSIRRPILRWSVDRVFEQHRRHGIEPNPLYSQGMARVGCMPCVNCGKGELQQIALRFPEHLERIKLWEEVVGKAQRPYPYPASFLHHSGRGYGIENAAAWARTSRGGKQFDMVAEAEAEMCSSLYGLCE